MLVDEEEYDRWMRQARHSIKSAKSDLLEEDFDWASFKAHQAGEYAIKALLKGLGKEAFGPSVSFLLKKITAPEGLIEKAKRLDKHYLAPRYPNQWSEGAPIDYYTKLDAEEAINIAEEIISWIESCMEQLKKEERKD
ncbi:MAG: HEPN domain-containing protein [Nitrososphaerales archaeon]